MTWRDARRYPPSGELVGVGDGRRLHERVMGAHEVSRRHLRRGAVGSGQLDDVPPRFRAEAADLGDLAVRLVSAGWPEASARSRGRETYGPSSSAPEEARA